METAIERVEKAERLTISLTPNPAGRLGDIIVLEWISVTGVQFLQGVSHQHNIEFADWGDPKYRSTSGTVCRSGYSRRKAALAEMADLKS